MNIPREAIEKAIEGGWNPSGSATISMQEAIERLRYEEIALDPTFWQALGKSLGWAGGNETAEMFAATQLHKFVDLILQGKSTEAFWQELLAH